MNNQPIQYDFFIPTQEGMDAIYNASIAVLGKSGITVQPSEALKMIEAAGAAIDWDTR